MAFRPVTVAVHQLTHTRSETCGWPQAGTYYCRVRALNGAGTGPPPNEVSFIIGSAVPGVPQHLQVSVTGASVAISWNAPATGGVPTGYLLEAGSASGLSNIASVPVAGTSLSVATVPAGLYFIRVRTTNVAGTGPASAETSFRVLGGSSVPPSAPTNLTAAVSGNTVTLAWPPPSSGPSPTGYVIQAGSAPGQSNLATLAVGATTSFSTSGVPSGPYFVRVTCNNAAGSSTASNEVVIIVP